MQALPKNKQMKGQGAVSSNPFAAALAETEKATYGTDKSQPKDTNSLFSQALAQNGDKLSGDQTPEDLKRQQEELAKKQKLEAQRKKLHDQINPVDTIKLFDAKEKRVKEELEKTRKELEALAKEIQGLHQELVAPTFQEIVNPGTDAAYYVSFFQKLRTFIMLLRQKVKSARTWLKATNSKNSKKKRKGKKFGAGIEVNGGASEQGKAVHDMMNQELSTAYSGA